MLFLKKAWSWLKAYWYIPAIIVAAVAMFLLRQKGVVDWADILDKARNSHKEEVDVINKVHKDEMEKREVVLKRMADVERQIREEYARSERELDKKTEKRVKKIIKKLKDDPDVLAKEIAKETGYHVVIVS